MNTLMIFIGKWYKFLLLALWGAGSNQFKCSIYATRQICLAAFICILGNPDSYSGQLHIAVLLLV